MKDTTNLFRARIRNRRRFLTGFTPLENPDRINHVSDINIPAFFGGSFKRWFFLTGFTLIELLVVISIISMLSSVVLSTLNSSRDKARLAAAAESYTNLAHAYNVNAAGIWDFEESTGNALDSSGNNNAATLYNSPARVAGVSGSALQFNGSTQYLRSGATVSVGSTWTLAAWVKPAAASITGHKIFMSFGLPYVSINGGKFFVSWSDGTQRSFAEPGTRTADRWYFVAASHSGNKTVLYVDGKEVARNNVYASNSVSNYFYIGRHSSSYYFSGMIDDVHVYTESLVSKDIESLYLAGVRVHDVASR